jgi:hypothetical protein
MFDQSNSILIRHYYQIKIGHRPLGQSSIAIPYMCRIGCRTKSEASSSRSAVSARTSRCPVQNAMIRGNRRFSSCVYLVVYNIIYYIVIVNCDPIIWRNGNNNTTTNSTPAVAASVVDAAAAAYTRVSWTSTCTRETASAEHIFDRKSYC